MRDYFFYANSDVGISKQTNQDALLVKAIHINNEVAILGLICDGLGGLDLGEIASTSVVKAFKTWFLEQFPQIAVDSLSRDVIRTEWMNLIKRANEKLLQYGQSHGKRLGTTISAILIYQNQYYIVNVGDSRIYAVDSSFTQLTKDQSLVQKELDKGNLTPEEAANDERQNILLECIGVKPSVHPDFYFGAIDYPVHYVFCSDGFRHVLTPDEIYDALNPNQILSKETAQQTIDRLIGVCKERNEKDNISVGVICVC